jgi:hypothetical protein
MKVAAGGVAWIGGAERRGIAAAASAALPPR